MNSKILYIFTRTPLHVGAGASVGAIDQPVQRERHTGFPIIPGSSVKGVLRDHIFPRAKEGEHSDADKLFGKGSSGKDASSGHISFGEARLIAFPVRSAKGAFALAVSPLTLSRLNRDAGWNLPIPDLQEGTALAGSKIVIPGKNALVLEEYAFKATGEFPIEWAEKLSGLLTDVVLSSAGGRFVLLSDSDLSHFAVNACQVNQHVRIDDETGTADGGALFNEETVPSETLFYAPFTVLRSSATDNAVFQALSIEQLIQFGGDGTTGLGFCTVKLS